MAGKKGRSGGARPGAGRKRKTTLDQQAARRETVLRVVHDDLWRATVEEWIQTARDTRNFGLLFPLLPYILGGRQDPVSGAAAELTVRIVTVDDRDRRPEIRVLDAG